MHATKSSKACTAGFVVAAATSVAILAERVTAGAYGAALAGDVVTTIVAVAVSVYAWRARLHCKSLLWTSVGAALAIFAVHAAIARFRPTPWLDETPRQVVNDVISAIAILGLIAVIGAKRIELARFVAITAPVAAYALTHAHWHVDRAPNGFAMTVQQCVVAQFVSVSLGLFAFRAMRAAWNPR